MPTHLENLDALIAFHAAKLAFIDALKAKLPPDVALSITEGQPRLTKGGVSVNCDLHTLGQELGVSP